MKKIIALSLVATLGLTACEKPASQPAEKTETATPQTNTTPTPPEQHAQDQAKQEGEHKDGEHGEHNHAHEGHGHDHAHGEHAHAHDHGKGDKYQCGDKAIHIATHDHEGEIEAHLTQDDITYDLNEAEKGKFVSDDDSIDGSDKGMVLKLDGNKATVSTPDDKVLLDCTKA